MTFETCQAKLQSKLHIHGYFYSRHKSYLQRSAAQSFFSYSDQQCMLIDTSCMYKYVYMITRYYTVHTSYNLNVTRVVHACHTQEPHVLYTSIFTSIHAITRNRIYLRVQAHTRNHHLLTRKAHFSTHTRIQVSRRVA